MEHPLGQAGTPRDGAGRGTWGKENTWSPLEHGVSPSSLGKAAVGPALGCLQISGLTAGMGRHSTAQQLRFHGVGRGDTRTWDGAGSSPGTLQDPGRSHRGSPGRGWTSRGWHSRTGLGGSSGDDAQLSSAQLTSAPLAQLSSNTNPKMFSNSISGLFQLQSFLTHTDSHIHFCLFVCFN